MAQEEDMKIIVKAAKKFKTIAEFEKKYPNNYDFGMAVREEINKQKIKKR